MRMPTGGGGKASRRMRTMREGKRDERRDPHRPGTRRTRPSYAEGTSNLEEQEDGAALLHPARDEREGEARLLQVQRIHRVVDRKQDRTEEKIARGGAR